MIRSLRGTITQRNFARSFKAASQESINTDSVSENPARTPNHLNERKRRKNIQGKPKNSPIPKRIHPPEIIKSKTRTPAQQLPESLMKTCLRIFSKYSASDVYSKGNAYMKLYTMLHASEKPLDFSKIKVALSDSISKLSGPAVCNA